MDVSVDFLWVFSILLVTVRLGWFFYATPLSLIGYLPAHIKLFIALSMSVVIITATEQTLASYPRDLFDLLFMVASEAVIGLLLALGLYFIMGAISIAGRILDFQSGFASANLFNPATNNQDPLFGVIMLLAFTFWFYWVGGHHYLLKMIVFSLEVTPLGKSMAFLLVVPVMFFGMKVSDMSTICLARLSIYQKMSYSMILAGKVVG